jgi:hypothetical protein
MLGAAFWCAAVSTADAWQRDLDATPLPSAMSAGDPGTGAPIPAMRADPQIVHAIDGISPSRIQHTIAALVGFRNRNTLSSMDADLPAGTGVSAAADWIEAQFKEISSECGGCLEVKRDTFTQPAGTEPNSRVRQPTRLTSVYAVLRGTDRDQAARMMLVTGHYDSRATEVMDTHSEAPGANDDASGVAVSLECARALSKLRLPATLVFVAVAGEEQGLFGSRHLAELAKQENWQLEGVLNNDIVGGNRTPGDKLQDAHAVRVFSESLPASATPEEIRRIVLLGYESDSSSRELARAVTDVARTYTEAAGTASRKPSGLEPVLEFRRDRFLRGGDHTSFNQDGFAAVRFTEWREDFNHQHQNVRVENGVQYGDLLQFVDFDYVARVAKLNAATLAVLAAAPPEPVNVTYPQEKVFDNSLNDTTIEWQNTPDTPPGTRYEIVWRATDAPDWQRSIVADKTKSYGVFKGGQTSQFTVTLPVSKDDVIFGVRAVDAAGHRSPAVVPWPARQR